MSHQRSATREGSVSRESAVAASAGLGAIAAVLGYLVTYVLVGSEVRASFAGNVPEWKGVAWYFYNAHLVEIEASGSLGGLGGTATIDFISQSEATRVALLYAVPPVVLLGIGALLARRLGARDLGEAALVGAPTAIGYALVLGIGAVVTESSAQGEFFGIIASGATGPDLGSAILLGGVLFPVVFATTGALIATVAGSR
ncbi:hypothetical protein [Halopiger goleimassiliensis]|uniref:hypothetical protein n=1 Tax=Halopiger goleimassiliensis TaxID=1293048 RepID=UPI0006777DB4|nr:hypothetical protein [Halopiger goleimassiliensis]